MAENFWLLLVMYLGPHPWPIVAATLTHTFAAFFHVTCTCLAASVLLKREDLRRNRFINIFFYTNIGCVIGRFWVVWTMLVEGHAPSPTLQLVSSLLSIMALGSAGPLVPTFIRLPSFDKIDALNQELAAKVVELEREKQDRETAQASLLQSQKMEAVGQLTGGIAHDFNNLIQAVSGSLELIQRNPTSERLDRWVGVGIDAIARAAHLTAQLLTFSRSQKLQLNNVQLKPALVNIRQMISRTLGPDIRVILGNIDEVTVFTDKTQLDLAVLNLSINARDAMPEGGSVTISTSIDDERVEINVSDTGTGIPDDIATRIFEPFFTTKDIGKGTGLGLSMVYGLASQSNGGVYIKKTGLTGTTITISLPMVEESEPVTIKTQPLDREVMCGSRNIVLIDDDPDVRDTLTEILNLLGHSVHACHDGPTALVHLSDHKPDLVLVDYAMPVMNGAQVVKAAKLIHPDMAVVFITGFSDSAELEGQTVLKKPFRINDIRGLLQDTFHCTNPI